MNKKDPVKKYMTLLTAALVCMIGLAGCAMTGNETDYPLAIMVDGEIYILAAEPLAEEVDASAIIGYTTSYTDTFPKKDGETNFNRELEMPYAKVKDGIAVLYDNEWRLCTSKD